MRRPKLDAVWVAFSIGAAILVSIGAFLPLWKLELVAPQYPKGLFIVARGYAMSGDIKEINSLNHYVGLKALDPTEIIELRLFPFSVVAVLLVVLIGAVVLRGKLRLISGLVTATVPVFILLDLQYQLYVFGRDIGPDAALDLEPFIPRVLGTTNVMNFHSVARVALGFWLFVGAALFVTIGPSSWRWLRNAWKNTGRPGQTVTMSVAVMMLSVGFIASTPPRQSQAAATASMSSDLIMEAIAKANPGDTVRIPPGVYYGTVTINKSIVLIGDGRPVIDGQRQGDVVIVAADKVTISGFVIRGSGREVTAESAGIKVIGERATIDSNKIFDVLYGVVLFESDGHRVTDNTIESIVEFAPERRGHALFFHYSNGNVIERNTITNTKDGIYLQFANDNTIQKNLVTHVRYGIHFMSANRNQIVDNVFRQNVSGGVLMFSGNVNLVGNEIAYNQSAASGYGLMLKEVDDIEIRKNLIHHNRVALALEGAPFTPSASVVVRDNLIGYNTVAVGLFTTTNVIFTGNTFAGNMNHVNAVAGSIEFKNQWSDGGRGNYWDDYRGYDADGNGIGDIKYTYRGAFDSLAENNPMLHAYDFTLARVALDLAAKWFPIYRPEPRVIDGFPLMTRTMFIDATPEKTNQSNDLIFMFVLVALPSLMFYYSSRSARKRWQKC